MSNIVNQLLETASPYQSVQKDASRLAGKWAKSGLLEGINGDIDKGNMAVLLENQAKQLVVEANTTGTGANFTPGTGEQYAAVALPLVRKVFGQIAAKEFVSVQPMTLPAGLVFFLWTVCNLFPRAISNHNWYQNKFEDYPKERKAVIPNII